MATFFASDVHLRLDRPERGRRFARWVETLRPDDVLYIVGDLCDFWFASRQQGGDPLACEGLAALAGFTRRGGSLTVLLGNHDAWLGPYYEDALKPACVADGELDLVVHGVRIRAMHGHLAGVRSRWKGFMEGEAFLKGFRMLPGPIAGRCERLLDRTNARHREAADLRHLAKYRDLADRLADRADLVIFGHTHRIHDDRSRLPRMIVLGDWIVAGSYLRVDADGARMNVLE